MLAAGYNCCVAKSFGQVVGSMTCTANELFCPVLYSTVMSDHAVAGKLDKSQCSQASIISVQRPTTSPGILHRILGFVVGSSIAHSAMSL